MDKKKIQELMKKRSSTRRETVKPVNFFEPTVNQQTSKPVNQQNGKTAKQQKEASEVEKTKKSATIQRSKNLIKYTTYLPDELITEIKLQAVLQKKKSYEIVIEALRKSLKV